MRLLSWNIHKGIGGLDRRYELNRIISVISHYNPDMVVLQEVDNEVPRSRHHDQTQLMAEILDYPYSLYGPNVQLKSGSYGNATLSRHPIVNSRNIHLGIGVKKIRGALYTEIKARIEGHSYTLHLFNIHLGLSGMERRMQVRRLLEADEIRRLGTTSRIVVSGDTNDWNGALGRGRFRDEGFECVTGRGRRASLTFPAWRPVSSLDRVYIRGPLVSDYHFCGRSKLCRQASDHLPVIVDFSLI